MEKWIVFGNSRKAIEGFHGRRHTFFNKQDLSGDVILITGTLFKHQFFYYTDLFLESKEADDTIDENDDVVDKNDNVVGENDVDVVDKSDDVVDDNVRQYNAIGCCDMRALGSAGWDSSEIAVVFSLDFPTSVTSVAQEKGRVGSKEGSTPESNYYYICGSLQSYESYIWCIYTPQNEINGYDSMDRHVTIENYRRMQEHNFLEVIKLFVLPTHFLHLSLEQKLSNPYCAWSANDNLVPSCNDACDFCLGNYKYIFPCVKRDGVTNVLLDAFLDSEPSDPMTIDSGIVTCFTKFKFGLSLRTNLNQRHQRLNNLFFC